ncbi:MAG: hypothetical protein GY930_11670 [bacterium]|nr:hypothetical protein [bacterium]
MNPNSIQGLSGSQNSQLAGNRKGTSSNGIAFRALLDGLEKQAMGLSQSSDNLQDSKGLADAVGQSERAIEQARALTDQLLESFRANQTRGDSL